MARDSRRHSLYGDCRIELYAAGRPHRPGDGGPRRLDPRRLDDAVRHRDGLAATFHRTAIAVLPLVIFARPGHRFLSVIGGLAAFAALFEFFLADALDQFVSNYIETKYSSQGAAIRIAMEVFASVLFLVKRKDFRFPPHEERMWFYFSLASFGALLALILTPSSTAVDRLSLYLMPMQVVILSRLPFVYTSRPLGTALVVAYCFAVQFVWLNFATHAKYWIPYKFYPLFD